MKVIKSKYVITVKSTKQPNRALSYYCGNQNRFATTIYDDCYKWHEMDLVNARITISRLRRKHTDKVFELELIINTLNVNDNGGLIRPNIYIVEVVCGDSRGMMYFVEYGVLLTAKIEEAKIFTVTVENRQEMAIFLKERSNNCNSYIYQLKQYCSLDLSNII